MESRARVLVMAGEGIGPEIVREGVRALQAACDLHRLSIDAEQYEVGKAALARCGRALPIEAERACNEAHASRGAILFGAVSDEPIGILRKQYDLFANLRPIRAIPGLAAISPLKEDRLRGTDILVVRELVSDVYYGAVWEGVDHQGRWASQEMYYHEREMRRITRVALEQARARRGRMTFVHKGNVIQRLFEIWQGVIAEERRAYPDVTCDDCLVDSMALQLVLRPNHHDVLLCPNLFGDILSDLGGGLLGSVGLLPSASLSEEGLSLYESVGGTAPDIAGTGRANPVSTILSAALLCRHTLHSEPAARSIERSVERALSTCRTDDIWEPGLRRVSTAELGDRVIEELLAGGTG